MVTPLTSAVGLAFDGDVNIVEIGGVPIVGGNLPVVVSGTVTIDEPVTVDGTVAVSSVAGTVTVAGTVAVSGGTVTVAEPVSVDDNGGSLTVDGTVAVSSVAGTVTIQEPLSIDDNGASLTVDGTVAVSSVAGTVTVAGTVAVSGGTVTVAEPVSVDDNGGSLTVDTPALENAVVAAGHAVFPAGVVHDAILSTLTVADNDWTNLRVTSVGSLWATLAGTGGTPVGVTAAGGLQVGTGIVENAPAAAAHPIFPAGVVRDDVLGALGVVDNDFTNLRVDATGALWIRPSGGVFVDAFSTVENAVVAGGHGVFPAGVVRDDALGTLAVADNDWTNLRVSSRGALWVIPDGTVTVGGTVTVVTGLLENAVVAAGHEVFPAGVVRDDALGTLAVADNDWTNLRVTSTGALWVRPDGTVTVGGTVTVVTGLLENAVVAAGHEVVPAGVVRDDALSALAVANNDWTEMRVNQFGALWVTPSSQVGNPFANFAPAAGFDVMAATLCDPDSVLPAGVNTALGYYLSGALRTGPDRLVFNTLFSAQVFNNTTTSANSSSIDVSAARWLNIYIDLAFANTPTDIRLIAQFSNDGGTTWFDWSVDQWVDLRYGPGQMPLKEVIPLGYVCGAMFRVRAVATGTTATSTFTLSITSDLIS